MSRNSLRRFPSINFLFKTLLVAMLAGAMALAGAACSDSTESTNSFDVGTGPITIKDKGPITREVVQNLANRKLGDAGVAGQPVVRSITLTPDGAGTDLNIEMNRTASCHSGALVGTAITMAQQMMSAIFLYPDVNKVQLTLYGPTEALKDKDIPAVRIVVTKEAAAKIDWFQFSAKTVSTLATEYWVEPCVYQSFQQYGDAVITDPALLAQANSTCTGTTTTP